MNSILEAARFYWEVRKDVIADIVRRDIPTKFNILEGVELKVFENSSTPGKNFVAGKFILNDTAVPINFEIPRTLTGMDLIEEVTNKLAAELAKVLVRSLE